jgi:pimeloyl-ACP methyl ester carboxylesterase
LPETLYASTTGAGGRVLVLIHGFGGSHAVWNRVGAALSHEATVIAYDLPGHGGSLAHGAAGRAGAMAKALQADLTARGIDRFHLVGHSMGGAVAALMAMNAPERVVSVTLVSPGGFGPEIDGALLRRFAAAANAQELAACLTAMATPDFVPDAGEIAAMLGQRDRPGQRDKLAEIAAMIARDDRQGVIPREGIAALPMPAKVLWGTHDPVLPYEQTRNLPPMIALHSFAGAGHMLLEERPAEVAALICRNMRGDPAR